MKKYLLFLFANSLIINIFAQRTLIHCGTLIDGVSAQPKKTMTIVVEKNKITAVQNGYTTPQSGDEVVDLKAKTVLDAREVGVEPFHDLAEHEMVL